MAVAKQAPKLLHGNDRQGALLPPTVVDHVPYDLRTGARGDLRAGDPDHPRARTTSTQVIRMSNSTAFGLSSGVCTNRLDYITRFIAGLEVGTVNIWEVPGYRIEMSPSAASRIPATATRKASSRR